jgi:hypothetical protein
MKKFQSFQELSRINYGREEEEDLFPGMDRLKIGCMQRIATACEAMAKDHVRLMANLKYYKDAFAYAITEMERLKRSNAALRGHLRRAKR